jgi:Na+/proline symporter
MLILPTILAIVVILGVVEYFKRYATTVEGFYVANRGMNVWLLTGTYVASWASITGMMGMSGLAYRKGIAFNEWTWGFWGVIFFTYLVGLPLRKVANYSHELVEESKAVDAGGLLTPPDFFQLRFPSKAIRLISAAMLICGLTFYAVGQLIGMTLAMTNLGLGYGAALLICTIILIWTTLRAGTPGIIVNDTINMITFVIAGVLIIVYALPAVGGIDNLVAVTEAQKPGMWGETGFNNTIFALISFNFIWNSMTAGSPHLVQRAYVAKDEKVFLKSQVMGVFIVITWTWFLYTGTQAGLILFPDLKGTASDNLLPLVAMKVMPTFLAGVVLASIFAIGFSTINTQVSNMAFSAARDVYQMSFNKDASEEKLMQITKIMIVVLALVVAFFAWIRPGFIYEVTAWGIAFYGAAFVPMFVVGFFWKRATAKGVLVGITASSLFFILLGLLKLLKIYELPFGIHPFLVTLPVSVILIIVVSLMTEQSRHEAKVAVRIREIVSRKTDNPAQGKDYVIPVVVIILSLAVMIYLLRMFS